MPEKDLQKFFLTQFQSQKKMDLLRTCKDLKSLSYVTATLYGTWFVVWILWGIIVLSESKKANHECFGVWSYCVVSLIVFCVGITGGSLVSWWRRDILPMILIGMLTIAFIPLPGIFLFRVMCNECQELYKQNWHPLWTYFMATWSWTTISTGLSFFILDKLQ